MLKLIWVNKFNNNFDAPYANCWALTMLICGGLNKPKWVEADEIEKWLALNTHGFNNKVRSGDILVMRSPFAYDRNNCIIHTAIYMGEGKYWHKPGSDVGQYATLKDVQKIYRNANIVYHVRLNYAQDVETAKKIDKQVSSLLKKAA